MSLTSSPHRILLPLLALCLGGAVLPAAAAAQACLGRAVGGLAARAAVGEAAYTVYDLEPNIAGADLGVGYWANPRGFAAYSVAYARRFLEEVRPDAHVAHLQLAGELAPVRFLPAGAGVCASAGFAGSWLRHPTTDERQRSYSVPLGLAVGLTLPVGPTTRLHPYVHPQVVFTEAEGPYSPGTDQSPPARIILEVGSGFARGPLVVRIRALAANRRAGPAVPPFADLRAGMEMGIRF